MRNATVILIAVAGTVLIAQEPKPTFEVASIRKQVQRVPIPPTRTSPDTLYRAGDTVAFLVRLAYDVQNFQVVGGPDWVRTDRFEINAKAGDAMSPEQMRLMLQALLVERFRLVLRRDQQEMRHLSLVLAREDGQLGADLSRCADPNEPSESKPIRVPRGGFVSANRCAPMSEIASAASGAMGTPVVDRTGLAGAWNYAITYEQPAHWRSAGAPSIAPEPDVRPFDVAIREQLGLRLESARGPVDVLVIDSVQQPTEN